MTGKTLLFAGGAFNLALVVFHLFFWKLFRWKAELARLTSLNRNVMQILNLCLTFVFVMFAYVSFLHPAELLSTNLGRSLLSLMTVFWYLRAAEQVWFFGAKKPVSLAFFLLFFVGGSLYAGALFL